jgi:hypothetical protein
VDKCVFEGKQPDFIFSGISTNCINIAK